MAKDNETLVIESPDAIKSIEVKDGKARVGAYAVRFSGPDQKDLDGEFFTAKTYFGARKGDGSDVLFNHGQAPDEAFTEVCDRVFAPAKAVTDDVGLFVEHTLDLADEYEAAIADLAAQGKLKWSSGATSHMVKTAKTGEIKRWPIAEFSYTPTPAEPRLPAIAPLKSVKIDEKSAAEIAKAFKSKKTELSANDLRDQVQSAAGEDPRFNVAEDGSECSMGIWVSDLLNDNGSWTAIIQAANGKYYEVSLTLSNGIVTLGAAAREVIRKTEYEPVEKSLTRKRSLVDMPKVIIMAEPTAEELKAANDKSIKEGIDARRQEDKEILALGAQFKCGEKAQEFIKDNKTANEFKSFVLEEVGKARPITTNPSEGLNPKEVKRYSVLKAIRDFAFGGKLEGLEKEASEATAKVTGRVAKGFFIPHDVASGPGLSDSNDLGVEAMKSLAGAIRGLKTLNQTTFGSGGALVGTEVLTSNLIELLRNRTVVDDLGARVLSGLTGNIAIPAQTGGATAYWLPETGAVTASDQALQQVGLTPKKLMGRTGFTKELLAQTDLSVEGFVREDLMRVLAIAKDSAAINGTGNNGQPLGILNLTGRATDVTFSTTATRAKAIEFQGNVATQNAFRGSMAYLTDPTVSAKWMGIAEASNFPKWLWDGTVLDGTVVGMRAVATNQVPTSHKVIFGNFNDLIDANWAGIDVSVNPYTSDDIGVVLVTIMLLTDLAFRHPVSFCVSTDSGAQ